MIQAIRETPFIAYIETEAKRIDTSVTSAHIRHLAKFSNDLDGAVFYAYAKTETINDRYTELGFKYSPTPNMYTGIVDLKPAGYYKYELYEVSWIGAVDVASGNAPATETDVLTPVADTKGVVQGLVAIGKLYLGEKSGEEEVQYTEYEAPSATNYIYTGVPSPDIFNEYSLDFDGVDDVLITTEDSSIMPTEQLTVGAWINPSTWEFAGNAQVRYPLGCVSSGGWGIYFENNYNATETLFKGIIQVEDTGEGSPGYLYPDGGTSYSVELRGLNGWHYITLTYTNTTGKASLYMDGKVIAEDTGAAGKIVYHPTSDRPLMFGADALLDTTGQHFFEGNIDEGSVWDKCLSTAEVLAVYNRGLPIDLLSNTGDYVSSGDLQGWWRMGDPTGTSAYPTIVDASTNTNNGTMTNMASGDIKEDVPK
tara:strand:+ start:299 stop:1567 length:1269 start_codon:yes stop_codon:yes gene_type:complete